jgi:hypothetical protein
MTTSSNTKQIKLTQGKYALVDEDDFERLNKHKWLCSNVRGKLYAKKAEKARRSEKSKTGFYANVIPMTNIILGLRRGIIIDHINGDSLDNRKQNLRVVTVQQNNMNRRKLVGLTSKYKGVYFDKSRDNYMAHITINGKMKNLGRFLDEKEAARAYDSAAISLFEQFALLNKTLFPEDFQ